MRRGGARAFAIAVCVAASCTSPDREIRPGGDGGAEAMAPIAAGDVGPPVVYEGKLPTLSLGNDAIVDWKRWPILRVGQRTVMKSTFDRQGGNHTADASHFIREDAHGWVTTDLAGSGVVAFVRTNHWHGSPWHYVVDGVDTVVSETSTADPDHPVEGSTFLPEASFPSPLAVTWSLTRGADLSWVPIPFEKSFELAYGRTHYGTGYYVIHRIAEGSTDVKTPIASWTGAAPPSAVLDVFARAGTDLTSGEDLPRRSGATTTIEIDGPATLRKLHVHADDVAALGGARLVVTWDRRATASIDAPVPLFFGTASFDDPEGVRDLVKAFPMNVRVENGKVDVATYFPMPFEAHARIEIRSDQPIAGLAWDIATEPGVPEEMYGLFHATYRDHGAPTVGRDLVLLDSSGVENASAWCGTIVGTSIIFTDGRDLGTLEGDPRFFFDDSETAQVQGTGTEEWGGGGDYWGGRTMTLPFVGHPVYASMYRFLLADSMPFGRRARLQLEHGALDDSREHYRSVAYWYGRPQACLVLADALDVGNALDESAHRYATAAASEIYSITSRHQAGVDHVGDIEIVPTTTEDGRKTSGATELDVTLPADNAGVLVRRTLDYDVADQRAEVFVAPIADDGMVGPMERAATWLTAGSTKVFHSNPPGETDAAQPVVEISNRRFEDDEILIARRFTAERKRVRIRFVPSGEWTELRYRIYAWRVAP